MDARVLDAQRWVNQTYGHVAGFQRCAEDGKATTKVCHAFIMALQHELGISNLAANFGATTTRLWNEKQYAMLARDSVKTLMFHAYYVKGISPHDKPAHTLYRKINGTDPGEHVNENAKFMKALLSMTAFTKLPGGKDSISAGQQWINRTYESDEGLDYVACDGLPSRKLSKTILAVLQIQLGIDRHKATGNYGPQTRSRLAQNQLERGASGQLVQIFSIALAIQGHDAISWVFDHRLEQKVRDFQRFTALPETGRVDYSTWAEALVSHGDGNRPVKAIDCISEITQERAHWLRDNGYTLVGRYLKNTPGAGTLDKEIKPRELTQIRDAGLQLFTIFQYYGGQASYFTWDQGKHDALDAIARAKELGVPAGATIFFAVDFDAVGQEIEKNVVCYFWGVTEFIMKDGTYRAGVYGPRYVCIRVSQRSSVTASFVSGMSPQFSGNAGYPLPQNWVLNQIAETVDGPDASCANPQIPDSDKAASCLRHDRVVVRPGTTPGFVPA